MDATALKTALLKVEVWPFLKVFPFKKVCSPDQDIPAIYVTLDDLEPFKPQSQVYGKGKDLFDFGLDALRKLSAAVHVVGAGAISYENNDLASSITLTLSGHYPATDPGVALYHNKTRVEDNASAYISGQDVIRLGEALKTGTYPVNKIVTVSGSLVREAFQNCSVRRSAVNINC